MKKELEQNLYNKYPKIFRQTNLSPEETSMCWGFTCGDGWYKIIDTLCERLQYDIDHNFEPQLEAVQVKEKFGTLRFYVNSSTDTQDIIIATAESLSRYTCEDCGLLSEPNSNDVRHWGGYYIRHICRKCHYKRVIKLKFNSFKYFLKKWFKRLFSNIY